MFILTLTIALSALTLLLGHQKRQSILAVLLRISWTIALSALTLLLGHQKRQSILAVLLRFSWTKMGITG